MGAVSGASVLTPAHQLFYVGVDEAPMILISLLTNCVPVSVQLEADLLRKHCGSARHLWL